MHLKRSIPSVFVMTYVLLAAFTLSGCGLLFGSSGTSEVTPTADGARALVPTFTSTPEQAAPPTAAPVENTPAVAVVTVSVTTTNPVTGSTAITATQGTTAAVGTTTTITTTVATTTTTTTTKKATLTITDDLVNARTGPGTDYGLAGSANNGQQFDLIGKSPAGDWWQVCCVNGQQVWIFGQLARAENADNVPVAAQIPPKPVVQEAPTAAPVAAQPTPAPAAPPTATPQPAVQAPPPSADPCAGIGGDGCKWKLRGGPKFAANGGGELKLEFAFIHSGNGNEAQGSYFVVMLKDGVKLPISDSIRSIAITKSQGPLGEYNYEYKVNSSSIPGNNIAGTYVVYVLDGNGERDSEDFTINVPDGQGEIWIQFDQA
ncbi:MAG: SH3 domain-containing protein [Chloroflexi bacterium]|nr:SH3 domain-containing protein [Chloroflexota bacterium]